MMTKHFGVCYTYAEAITPQEKAALLSPLEHNSLATISDKLLANYLQQSIMEINLDKIEQTIDNISHKNELLPYKLPYTIE